MRLSGLLWVAFFVIAIPLLGQNGDGIEYIVIEDTIKIKLERPLFKLNCRIHNTTQNSFILYGFNNAILVAPTIDFDYEKSTTEGAGNELYLFDSTGSRARIWEDVKSPHVNSVSESSRPMKGVVEQLAILYSANKVIVTPNSTLETSLQIDLSDTGPLTRGVYLLHMVYTSGELTRAVLGERTITSDMNKYRAIVFDGFIRSQNLVLIVE